MSIYTTPLQFAYFFGLLIAVLLFVRAYREERQSDAILGFVMFFLAMEIQDYTFGFAGINYLWEEMNGFPRYFNLAFAPTIYYYLKSQINKFFKFERKYLLHYVPYFIYILINISYFLQGSAAVLDWQKSSLASLLSKIEMVAVYISYIYYFYKSLLLYHDYKKWTFTEFSNTENVSFEWLRNFIYLIIAGEIFKFSWSIADKLLGDLPYEQDWWWHLFTVCIIIYVGLKGYTQRQPKNLIYRKNNAIPITQSLNNLNDVLYNKPIFNITKEAKSFEAIIRDSKPIENFSELTNDTILSVQKTTESLVDFSILIPKIEKIFLEDKIFLESELSLSELAQKLKTNSSILSAAINQTYKKNFNDFVNEYRIQEFEKQIENPQNKNFTKLAIAMDCGFNSRATFHRAIKKFGSIEK